MKNCIPKQKLKKKFQNLNTCENNFYDNLRSPQYHLIHESFYVILFKWKKIRSTILQIRYDDFLQNVENFYDYKWRIRCRIYTLTNLARTSKFPVAKFKSESNYNEAEEWLP